jgi:hypothetical protein
LYHCYERKKSVREEKKEKGTQDELLKISSDT